MACVGYPHKECDERRDSSRSVRLPRLSIFYRRISPRHIDDLSRRAELVPTFPITPRLRAVGAGWRDTISAIQKVWKVTPCAAMPANYLRAGRGGVHENHIRRWRSSRMRSFGEARSQCRSGRISPLRRPKKLDRVWQDPPTYTRLAKAM